MTPRRLCTLLTVPAALAMAACTSSGAGGSTVTSTGGGVSPKAAALGARLEHAVDGITSAHVRLDVTLAGQTLTGEGDEQLDHGKLVALDITERLPGGAGAIRIISVGGKTYAKLPRSLNATGKPYLLVTSQSSNSLVKQLAASLDTALSSASLGSTSVFVRAAQSIDEKGVESVAGIRATHYVIKIDVAKLPESLPGKSELVASGLETLPVELYVDPQGRPVQITESLKVQGQAVSTKATVTDFNKPVSITAPPPNQVGS